MEVGNKLEVGEKFLSIKMSISDKFVNCYPVKEKKNPKEPDFRGEGFSIWVHEKKPEKTGGGPL